MQIMYKLEEDEGFFLLKKLLDIWWTKSIKDQ